MKQNIDIKWKLTHGMYITGTKSPYDFFKSIEKHRISDCISNVTQNVLLLAGENDQYVPVGRMEDMKAGLKNAKSVTSRIFTEKEGGAQHCQVGALYLVQEEINAFLKKYGRE